MTYDIFLGINGYDYNLYVRASSPEEAIDRAKAELNFLTNISIVDEKTLTKVERQELDKTGVFIYSEGT